MIQLGPGEKIIDEEKFLETTLQRSKGNPASWDTIAAKDRLEKYYAAKSKEIPEQIINSLNTFINAV